MEDLRDPTAQSIMMVQTSESRDTFGDVESGTAAPGLLHSELVGNIGALYIEGTGGLTRRETYAPPSVGARKQLTANVLIGGAKEAVQEMDSGIWDMMHALELGNDRQLFSSSGNSLAHVDLFQTTRALDEDTEYEEESVGNLHRSPSDELQGTYKMYQINDSDDGGSAVIAADSVSNGLDGGAKQRRKGLSKKESRDRDKGGLSDVLQPVTVVNFAIHRFEVPIVRLETVPTSTGVPASTVVLSSTGVLSSTASSNNNSKRGGLDESVGTQTSVDLGDKSLANQIVEPNDRRASGASILNDDARDETLRADQSTVDNRIRKLCVEIQNLTANEQSAISEFCMKSQSQSKRSSRCTSPYSPDGVDGKLSHDEDKFEDEGDGLDSPHAREAYRDIVEITSVRSAERANRNRRKSGNHGEYNGVGAGWLRGSSVRKSKSERSSPRTSRLMNAEEFPIGERSLHSADGSPTRQYFAINSPELELLPLRSSSPCVNRASVSKGQGQFHASSSRNGRRTLHSSTLSVGHAENDARSMATTMDSSLGNLYDESLEVIEFERFTDWMGELPGALQNVPLSSISIPGLLGSPSY